MRIMDFPPEIFLLIIEKVDETDFFDNLLRARLVNCANS